MAIKFAKDAFGQTIQAKDAVSGITYRCCICNVRLFKKVSCIGNAFFSCFPGNGHRNEICRNTERQKLTHTVNQFDIEIFFKKILKSGRSGGGGKPKKEMDGPEDVFGPGDVLPEDLLPEDDGGIEKTFSSLRQMWNEGLTYTLEANTEVSKNSKAYQLFAFPKWYELFFCDFEGGKAVILAKPDMVLFGDRAILLRSSWKMGEEWQQRKIKLNFIDRKLFEEYVKLQEKTEDEYGRIKRIWRHDIVLVVGDWRPYTYTGKRGQIHGLECTIQHKNQMYWTNKG